MSSEKGKKRLLIVAAVWLAVLACGGLFVKKIWFPQQKDQLLAETGSSTQYREHITGYADAFSGYSILRSPKFHALMKADGIKVTVKDDAADYTGRAKALRDGDIQWAVFTIDSFVKACCDINELPGTIGMVIDETSGADAIVAIKSAVGSISDLDDPNARIVMTRNSPSEFISRIVVSEFSLPSLPDEWWIEADGAEDVYKKLRKDKGNKLYVYALWEPFVSKALEDDRVHTLIDSSKLSGYVVDVIVFERTFLRDHPDTARTLVESYQRAAFAYGGSDKMTKLIEADDKTLSSAQARNIADGIVWKTTLENYAHFGLHGSGVPHVEDMIINITNILIQTGAIPQKNPVVGNEHQLFYDGILADMQIDSFHPAKKTNILANTNVDLGEVRVQKELPKLSPSEWNKLVTDKLKVDRIQFGRGTSTLTNRSQRSLRDLADRMTSLPEYYLLVAGQSAAKGDPEANRKLAESRADTVMAYLSDLGMSVNRLNTRVSTNVSNSSVSFVAGQRPY